MEIHSPRHFNRQNWFGDSQIRVHCWQEIKAEPLDINFKTDFIYLENTNAQS